MITNKTFYPRIWIDLENSPHVPFFVPIILELEKTGCEVMLTARDFAQTKELVEQAGLNARMIGGEYGNSTPIKAMGLASRAMRLAWMMKGRKISLAVGHGSRGMLLAAKMLGIPTLTLYDYEGASVRIFNRLSTWVMTPESIPFATLSQLGLLKEKHLSYPGLKEDVYVASFTASNGIMRELGLDASKIILTIRPPSSTAHYRSEESFRLYDTIMEMLAGRDDVQVVLLPRNKHASVNSKVGVIIPSRAVDGTQLVYHSDLVISGGGTMNREAAALGVPVVTIFKGPMGAVDRWLIDSKRMISIERAEEIVPLLKKREPSAMQYSRKTKEMIVQEIIQRARR
ncbi:MAG TPA: DUF354 domain-containing protein [Candidatus Kapabacteria bacterium]|jgi:hypothetical protein